MYSQSKGQCVVARIKGDFMGFVENCEGCRKNRPVKHQPLRTTVLPEGTREYVGSDLFEFQGRNYLVVDYSMD